MVSQVLRVSDIASLSRTEALRLRLCVDCLLFAARLVCAGVCLFLAAATADTLDRVEPWTDEAEYYIPVNDWEPVAALPPSRFRYIQLCDAPQARPETDEELLHQGRFERQFPGDGGLDLFELMAALPEGIPISLEAPRRALLEEVGYEEIARQSFAATRKWLDEFLANQ